jgi:hypothetical protein
VSDSKQSGAVVLRSCCCQWVAQLGASLASLLELGLFHSCHDCVAELCKAQYPAGQYTQSGICPVALLPPSLALVLSCPCR